MQYAGGFLARVIFTLKCHCDPKPGAVRKAITGAGNMINPSETGSPGEMLRLRTLESVWVQGKLRMWGRWSYMGSGQVGSMFNQLLTGPVITQSDINDVRHRIQEAGISAPELEAFFRELLRGKSRSPLAFCTDEEGLAIDRVLADTLLSPGRRMLYDILVERYRLRKSKRQIADALRRRRPEWSPATCRRRTDVWLGMSESILYLPLCDAFGVKSDRFRLRREMESN